jgi:hypothetical protein
MIRRMRCRHVALLCCCLTFSVSCGSLFSTCHDCPPPPPADNSGSWSGSIEVPSIGSGGYIDMAMVQSGKSIQSTRMQISSLIGPPDCGVTATMTGEIDGSNIVMTITENTGDVLSFIGTIGTGPMSGTYSSKGTYTNGISGTFSFGQVLPITSTQWTGTITSSSTTTTFTANLNEDKDANLTGSVQFSGTACPNAVSVTGSVTGIQVHFQDTQGGSLVNAGGTISGSEAKSIGGSAGGAGAEAVVFR